MYCTARWRVADRRGAMGADLMGRADGVDRARSHREVSSQGSDAEASHAPSAARNRAEAWTGCEESLGGVRCTAMSACSPHHSVATAGTPCCHGVARRDHCSVDNPGPLRSDPSPARQCQRPQALPSRGPTPHTTSSHTSAQSMLSTLQKSPPPAFCCTLHPRCLPADPHPCPPSASP